MYFVALAFRLACVIVAGSSDSLLMGCVVSGLFINNWVIYLLLQGYIYFNQFSLVGFDSVSVHILHSLADDITQMMHGSERDIQILNLG